MSEPPMKRFTCSYHYQGSDWCFEIIANDFADAEARLERLVYARLDGEIMASGKCASQMPDPIKAGFFMIKQGLHILARVIWCALIGKSFYE